MLAGSTVVWACVAQGGVAQLAADVLIATLPVRLVARLHHDGLLPLAGYAEPGDAAPLLTAVQGMSIVLVV